MVANRLTRDFTLTGAKEVKEYERMLAQVAKESV